MPELPDVEIYVEALSRLLIGQPLQNVRVASPFLLRTFDPPLESCFDKSVREIRRLGKRIVLGLEEELFLVLHLMIAGRLHWKPVRAKITGKIGLAAFDFPNGTVLFTEASPKKRASLHVVRGAAGLAEHDPGGLEVLTADFDSFRARLLSENHTLKRSLTSPQLFSGIGNAYSDEVLHRAQLSPLLQTKRMNNAEIQRLLEAIQVTMREWMSRFRDELGDRFPEKVTAFRPEMAVHGKFGEPCPVCGTKVERIVYAENECNYCPRCQTKGKRLADRSLSRLLKDDWPREIDREE